MEFGKSYWRTYEQGIGREWLLTNGIGGFSSSTLIGANARRYHGLLVASLHPPVQRHLVLSKIDESLEIEGRQYNLYSSATPGSLIEGFHHLQRVRIDPLPTFIYQVEDVRVEKTVCMVYGENTVAVLYRIVNGGSRARLRLTPLVNFRDYHFDSHRHHMRFHQNPSPHGTSIRPYDMELEIRLHCGEAAFTPLSDCYFENMDYAYERERGLQATEDHYIPGYFHIEAAPWEDRTVTVIGTVEKELPEADGPALLQQERTRMEKLVRQAGFEDPLASALAISADQFIVDRRSTGAKTIIAGYPWFTDWGRDTMIALPGLTLVTRRFDDARQILYTFSRYVKYGLLPNVFPDEGQEPAYNSVDAALWYFEAVGKFARYTGEYDFIRENLYPSLKEIVQTFMKGTLFQIRLEADGLITAGDPGTQLTWMDAKVGSWVVTPRHGKAVEINALWYNALLVLAQLTEKFGEDAQPYRKAAEDAARSFREKFWNEEEQCLFDVITNSGKDGSVRPNQVLAVSLTYPVIQGEMARMVVWKIWKELYTAYGLRSLSSRSPQYQGSYRGDQVARDGAYHQGTVWTWPLGHFITAFARTFQPVKYRETLESFITPFRDHLADACIGSISEIFDGNEPLIPRGCFAQAWSVGEVLRAYVEDVL